MIAPPDLQRIALDIRQAQDEARLIGLPTAGHAGFDLEAAYATARQLQALRLAEGDVAVGRKIGFTNAALWPIYGVWAPIWGPVYARTLQTLEDGTGRCSLGRFVQPRIEPEIALRLRCPPPPQADAAAVQDCVDAVAQAFEIVHTHYAGWKFTAPDTVADGALHGALLLGPPRPLADIGADAQRVLQDCTLGLWRDGRCVDRGRGAHALGSPLAAVAHLAAVLAQQPEAPPLRAGEWITTGTLTDAWPVAAGEVWHTELQGVALPGLRVAFTA